jgi:Flp pilus assembly protein TadG
MRRYRGSQQGNALVELALLLPLLALTLVGLIELGNAINAHMTVLEASRSGARLAVLKKDTSEVEEHVRVLMERLPETSLTVNTTQGTDGTGNKMYTVEVQYEYRTILSDAPVLSEIIPDPFILRAQTTMPIP